MSTFWQALKSDKQGTLYALAASMTTIYLVLYDDSVYSKRWNWIVAFLVDLGVGVFWPIYWLFRLVHSFFVQFS